MIKVSVNGALGRMGLTVCQAVLADSKTELIESLDINSKRKIILLQLKEFQNQLKQTLYVNK